MNTTKLEILILISVATLAMFVSGSQESTNSVENRAEILEKISQNYIEKTERAQRLRKELHDQLNLLSHMNTMSDHDSNDKYLFSALLGRIRRTFLDLDEILDGFVPSVADAHEIVANFKVVSEQSGLDHDDASEASSSSEVIAPRLMKRFDWFKRNNVYNYNKVPVIRTGK